MKKILSLMLVLSTSSISFSQSAKFDPTNARDGESVEYCATHKKHAEFMKNPAAVASFAQDELIRTEEAKDGANSEKGGVFYIPIVFHVLHSGGEENISDEQVLDAFDILNRDFRLLNADANNVHPDFQGLPADVEIEFRLATKAPNGTCFTGITHTQNALSYSSNGGAQVNAIVSGNDVYNGQWPGDEYLNVFICGDIGGAGLAGYTYTPSTWAGSGMDNGIWLNHIFCGSIGTGSVGRSRTLTHEVGHWLNLQHTWGPNNNPGNAASCNDDDFVNDTPNTIGVTFCNLNEMTCGSRANVENYMDYSFCSKMFTPGQATRMRNAIQSNVANRDNLITSQNLAATGADGNFYLCNAEFSANKTSVCAGDNIQFSDESFNAVTSWNWSFEGGTPSTSTDENPLIQYNTPGLYQVELSASDGSNTDVETKTSYIRVLPGGNTIPFFEGFESYSSLNNLNEWEVINQQGNSWELYTSGGLNSAQSARIMNYLQPTGTEDELVSAPVDLSGVTSSMTLSFRYAYKRRNSSDDDWFRVYVTNNCGDSWDIRKTLHGYQLSTLVQSSQFAPSSQADWTTVHMTNITNSHWVNNFRYKFYYEAGGGNNFYLDNINIYEGSPSDDIVLGLGEPGVFSDLNVFPNPTDNELNVKFTLDKADVVSFDIVDISGKSVQNNIVNANAGNNLVFLDTKDISSGMYFLNITIGSSKEVVQFVVK